MKFNVHGRTLHVSLWLALSTILMFPGTHESGPERAEYGFPLRFFTDYMMNSSHESTIWYIQGMNFQVGNYFLNVVLIYSVIRIAIFIKNKWFTKRADHEPSGDI
ncbi:hypothetical protein JCM10914A_50970 [Paenibacillus sp. JCM 10914]|uniref:hypothetical protein n=1 Tax=Paenibacillus sp. JCM 10914 TaxID=1236974 RepID=UPI0003CCB86D|nr:hypothetical protein [Paenibacillus sp. JCM 10914]GAE05204.1 hypothetical protein JCM10914_1296 [Paenibacillus sp. JCM 10914]